MDTERQTLLPDFPAPYNQAVELLRKIPCAGAQKPLAGARSGTSAARLLARLLGWWHLTSLDAPTVAVCWCEALASITRVRLPLWVPVALGLGTWSIYLGDRLMDARRALAPLRERHWFHWRHRAVLLPVAIASLIVALALVLRRMPQAIRARDAVLALAAAIYFAAIHSGRGTEAREAEPEIRPETVARGLRRFTLKSASRFASKETFVGLIFAMVCAAPAATRAAGGYAVLIAPVAACFLLAWLNCWLIERWDAGRSGGYLRQLALAAAASLAALLAFLGHSGAAGWFLVAMAASALLLAWLERHRLRLGALVLRAAADLVLLTPLILLLGHPGL